MLRALLVIPVLLLAAACSGGSDEGDSGDPGADGGTATEAGIPSATPLATVDISGTWTLEKGELDGTPLELDPANPITLDVAGKQATGTSVCNDYGFDVTSDETGVEFGGGFLGPKGCTGAAGQLENSYLGSLVSVEAGERTDTSLVLTGQDVSLTYAAS